jgi:superfamily II DNA/RNA helicase
MGRFLSEVSTFFYAEYCSDMSQRDRETMWQKFVWGKRPILFASDLMSHGIDVQHLNVVRMCSGGGANTDGT